MNISVPERNRAVKKLLQKTFPEAKVSVRAGDGTAYHWIEIKFSVVPDALADLSYGPVVSEIERLLNDADIQFSTYSHDDGTGASSCISLSMPREVAHG